MWLVLLQDIYHRDLRMENLLLDGQFFEPTLKISDFSYSKNAVLDSQPKTNVGVPAYTPPELLLAVRTEGSAYDGSAIDVWSSGVIMFYMLTGQLPFTVRFVAMLSNFGLPAACHIERHNIYVEPHAHACVPSTHTAILCSPSSQLHAANPAVCPRAVKWPNALSEQITVVQDPAVPNALSRKMMQRIVNVQYDVPRDVHLSPECLDLLANIFVADPTQRIRVADILRCVGLVYVGAAIELAHRMQPSPGLAGNHLRLAGMVIVQYKHVIRSSSDICCCMYCLNMYAKGCLHLMHDHTA